MPGQDQPARIPYPHSRNDCEMCRERDADFHVLGEEWNQPGKRQLLLCQQCFGAWLVIPVYWRDRGKPFTVTVEIPEKRRGDFGL